MLLATRAVVPAAWPQAIATAVLYRDFGLNIPDSPVVDTVADDVRLELEFVAQAIAG